jgi:hypothetical protein
VFIVENLKELLSQNFYSDVLVKNVRRGDTAVGTTAEHILGIAENNSQDSDLPDWELKGHRNGSDANITMFTKAPLNRANRKVLEGLGYIDDKDRLAYKKTVSGRKPNGDGLIIFADLETIRITDGSKEWAVWKTATVVGKFNTKIKNTVFVYAESQAKDGDEFFRYTHSELCTCISSEKIITMLNTGEIVIDFRLHREFGKIRDHGTAFRLDQTTIPKLFEQVVRVDFGLKP